MPNDNPNLIFPSGLPVYRAKERAKKLVKDKQFSSITNALDAIAQEQLGLPWAKALPEIKALASQGITYRMTQKDIKAVMDQWPSLTLSGLKAYRDREMSLKEHMEVSVPKQRQELLEAVDQCNKACMYLHHLDKRKTINWSSGSYGLKHAAEHYLKHKQGIGNKYVANGAFICAAIHMGFTVKPANEHGLNACINYSMRSPVIRWRKLKDTARPLSKQMNELDELEQLLGLPVSAKVAEHRQILEWNARHKS